MQATSDGPYLEEMWIMWPSISLLGDGSKCVLSFNVMGYSLQVAPAGEHAAISATELGTKLKLKMTTKRAFH